MIEFEWLWAFLLTPLPLLMYFLIPAAKHSNQAVLKVPFYQNIEEINREFSFSQSTSYLKVLSLFIIWLLLVCAAAKPTLIGKEVLMPAKGRDLMLAVDVSGSMQQTDLKINDEFTDRLSVVKSVLSGFIKKRKGDRLGLILFGSNAYLQTPLTFDQITVERFLFEAEIGVAGQQTAIGDAIGLAIKRLANRPVESRVLILLTDGANTAGEIEPLQAAKLANEKDLKIYTVAIGADEMRPTGFLGSFFNRTINPSADLDEATLKEIAEVTGGQYFRAKDTAGLELIYEQLDKLEPVDSAHKSYRPKKSLYYVFLGAAVVLSWLYCLAILVASQRQKNQSLNHNEAGRPENVPTQNGSST